MRRGLSRFTAAGALGIVFGAGVVAAAFAVRQTTGDGDAGGGLPSSPPSPSASATVDHPNVVLVLSDDQRWDKITPEYMPNVWELSQRRDSVLFQNAFVPNPLCCPSRTTILTGRYSHSTGVWNNNGVGGGFPAFHDDGETIAVDFQSQGYRTALIGKYLNQYFPESTDYIPPGWDRWFAIGTGQFYDYVARTDAGPRTFGSEPGDYVATVLVEEARRFIDGSGDDPFFLFLSFTAPHEPSIPEPRDLERFAGEPDVRTPAVDGSMLGSAFSMDRAIGDLLEALPEDTVILFASDNGFMWGETHPGRGQKTGKRWPYDASIRIPMIIAGLDHAVVPIQASAGDLVANVDLRVSLLHAAGLAPLSPQEGFDWFDPGYVAHDHLIVEFGGGDRTLAYCGIRTLTKLYVRYQDGFEELFDYVADPGEQRNLAREGTAELAGLRAQAKSECRPRPPGFSWKAVAPG